MTETAQGTGVTAKDAHRNVGNRRHQRQVAERFGDDELDRESRDRTRNRADRGSSEGTGRRHSTSCIEDSIPLATATKVASVTHRKIATIHSQLSALSLHDLCRTRRSLRAKVSDDLHPAERDIMIQDISDRNREAINLLQQLAKIHSVKEKKPGVMTVDEAISQLLEQAGLVRKKGRPGSSSSQNSARSSGSRLDETS